MARALVIGGRGFYGSLIVDTMRKTGHDVTAASRRGDVAVDLADPGTFEVLRGYDLIINASDTVNAPPDAAAAFCLQEGLTWLDVGADLPATERLLALPTTAATGRVIVGVGSFPGLSTLLARTAYDADPDGDSVDLSVRLSPLSGAGPGLCALMTDMLALPSVRWVNGARTEGPAMGSAADVPFSHGAAKASIVGLPDAALIARTTSAANVTTRLAVVPFFLRFSLGFAAALIRWSGPLRPALLWVTRKSLILIRSGFLRRVKARVQLTARAGDVCLMLDAPAGQAITAQAACALAVLALEEPPPPGVHTAADLTSLDTALLRTRELGGTVISSA